MRLTHPCKVMSDKSVGEKLAETPLPEMVRDMIEENPEDPFMKVLTQKFVLEGVHLQDQDFD